MFKFIKPVLAAALFAFAGLPASAADYVEPAPPPPAPVEFGGWYIRGDIDYHWTDFRGADYITYGVTCCGAPLPGSNSFTTGDLDGGASLGVGVGYQINDYLRTDLTADYWFDQDFTGSTSGDCAGVPCTSTDTTNMSTWLLLANAYADLGTYEGFTPYIGAGIGGAHVKWDDLHNTIAGVTTIHPGDEDWRFAWALMAGTSYCLTDNVKLDVGYRFSHINGGRMFGLAPNGPGGAGPGFDDGFNTHEVRGGLRYDFGYNGCAPAPVPYEPPAPAVYK